MNDALQTKVVRKARGRRSDELESSERLQFVFKRSSSLVFSSIVASLGIDERSFSCFVPFSFEWYSSVSASSVVFGFALSLLSEEHLYVENA